MATVNKNNSRRSTMDLNFVLCHRYHGATALALLLNNHPDVSSLGDMFPGIVAYEETCGCGAKVHDCEFWQKIDREFRSMRQSVPPTVYPMVPRLSGKRSINDVLARSTSLAALCTTRHLWRVFGASPERFIEFYLDFINAVNEYNRSSIFVNGSKALQSVLAIKSILGSRARINIIHLYRDPRGFYCSERKDEPGMRIERSAKRWKSYHERVSRIVRPLCGARYLPIRYEDLCERPETTMAKVFAFIGVDYQDVFFPPATHHTMGNATMQKFDGRLRQSLTWKSKLTKAEQLQCLDMTGPLSAKLAYNP